MMTCSVQGCEVKSHAKGMCKLHYQRTWRVGSPQVSRPCLHLPIEAKFWLYVKQSEESECWPWTGFLDADGYGKVRSGKNNIGAHRVSYELHFGALNRGEMVLHECNSPSCVNPSHLRVGDHGANMVDRMQAGHYPTNEGAPSTKFSNAVVAAVRSASGTYEQIGRTVGMSASQVGNIRRGDQRPVVAEAA